MKQQKRIWKDTLKEIVGELLVIIAVFLLCGIALIIAPLIPKDLIEMIPFEIFLLLIGLAIFAVMWVIYSVVIMIAKIRSKKDKTNSN